ncbi:hypothetical protein [Dongia deserti]|uniref:hypothetical protein n=1 Tax=Dongia deserti TaxID=2268030 RepID=UPI0013C4A2BE|nr:hypothetical protein [Dongia deserti]
MNARREVLLGLVAGAAGFGLLSSRAFAWYLEEMTPDQEAAFLEACRAAPVKQAENHTGLIAAARQSLAQRIANGQLPSGTTEQVGCPVCGCSFVVTADGTN